MSNLTLIDRQCVPPYFLYVVTLSCHRLFDSESRLQSKLDFFSRHFNIGVTSNRSFKYCKFCFDKDRRVLILITVTS